MADREKVIGKLESLRDICNAKSDMAIGNGKVAWAGYANAANDALTLLKEQEPRVLTFEEVQNDCPDYVYLEMTSGWFECCIKDEGESDIYLGYFAYGIDEYFMKRWREYGKTWRCWSARPTDKQRKAVKWDERNNH